jgi:hypothetical protein
MRETRLSNRPDACRVHFNGATAPRPDSITEES